MLLMAFPQLVPQLHERVRAEDRRVVLEMLIYTPLQAQRLLK